MKWIVDEELIFHNLDDIGQIWMKTEYSINGNEYFTIVGWDKVDKIRFIIETLYLSKEEAQEYFISRMKAEFSENNIHFLEAT